MAKRVLTIAPMPPEKCAYALARYSRSPDSIRESIEWVRTHDSQKFLESFYFQYGHASIADLGHVVTCFEGISEIAATDVEDEQLWDGQARSSRYQDFSKSGAIVPSEFSEADAARAVDVARYVLFLGVPTGVGQVTSIRTLERQIRRLKASEYAEIRTLADEIAEACSSEPECKWNLDADKEPVAPTLARYVDTDAHIAASRADLRQWAEQNLSGEAAPAPDCVDLLRPSDATADIVATLLYPVTARPYRDLYERACAWSEAQRNEVIDVALRSRTTRDELLRAFRGGPYVYDIIMDIGAYRDLHRHRRCQQLRQRYGTSLGYDTPATLVDAGLAAEYQNVLDAVFEAANRLPQPGSQYLLPFGTRARFLFRMDFAEAEYICRLRSGVKGHFSYRQIAWQMKEKMRHLEPQLGRLMEATPPWIEDPLKR